MNFNQKLENLLKQNEKFCDNNNELSKQKVKSYALEFDEDLIGALLNDADTREHFFKKISDATIFDYRKFIDFMDDKNFLLDSYTKFSNKVGLTISNKHIKQIDDVVLTFPFKDCVLEGGQSKEDENRKEIFFNETLAKDEINRLLDKKVITNATKYYYENNEVKETQDIKFTRDKEINKARGLSEDTITDNLIIKGNNLLALHTLKSNFAGKVKLIYIDPPYYFTEKKEEDSFKYNSNFKLSTWITFMKNRLEVAKELLKEDGIIFISIDDGGQAHLKLLMDEIFLNENFLVSAPTIMNLKGNNDEFGFSGTHEYTLIYALSKKTIKIGEFNIDDEDIEDEWIQDKIGYYKKGRGLIADSKGKFREDRPYAYFPILIKNNNVSMISDEEYNKIYNSETLLFDDEYIDTLKEKYQRMGYTVILPLSSKQEKLRWTWGFNGKFKTQKNDIIISHNTKKDTYTICKKQRPSLSDLPTKKPKSIFYKPEYSSSNGTAQIETLFGSNVFTNPKPIELIKDFIQLGTINNGDIVLDFHAGSGTTGNAILDINKDNKKNLQFILVEQMDYIEDITAQRINKVITNNKLGEFIYFELDKYNQKFIDDLSVATKKDILKIYKEIAEKGFLNYDVELKKVEEHFEEFKAFSLEQQKEFLISMLNKNQLYKNLSEINDKDLQVSDKIKELNKSFYNISNKE